jgi:hypothetical protein
MELWPSLVCHFVQGDESTLQRKPISLIVFRLNTIAIGDRLNNQSQGITG